MTKESQLRWDLYFIELAHVVSKKSKDPSTHVGAILVDEDMVIRASGFNGFARGVHEDIPSRWERPEKYGRVSHAEFNCVCAAARVGVGVKGTTLYLNWWPWPCSNCSLAVIQAGVKCVVGPNRPFVSANNPVGRADWEKSFELTRSMFEESGVETRVVEIPEDLQKQFGWTP